MERCSVMSSEGKIESEGMLTKGMEWGMSVTSPPPPASPGRSFRIAVQFGKEFDRRNLVEALWLV